MYSDEDNELIGIDKTSCSRLKMVSINNQIEEITFFVSPDGNLYPDKDLPVNKYKLRVLYGVKMNVPIVYLNFSVKKIINFNRLKQKR